MPESFNHPAKFASAHASESMPKGGIPFSSDLLWCHIFDPNRIKLMILCNGYMLDKPLAMMPDKGPSALDISTDEKD